MRFALAVLVAFAAAMPALAQPEPPHPPGPRPATFVLSGEGSATAAPDIAVLTSGVVSQGDTARAALDTNTAAMQKLIASLKDAGIEPKDIQTSGFSIQPRYVYSQRNDGQQEPPRIVGYEVRNNITGTVRDLSKLGAILDSAVTEGSNQISGLAFDVSNKTALLNEARKRAFADAKAKAELYAEAAGLKLGRLRDLSEQAGAFPPPRPMMRMEAAAAPKADVPIEQGEQELQVNITATWEIAP